MGTNAAEADQAIAINACDERPWARRPNKAEEPAEPEADGKRTGSGRCSSRANGIARAVSAAPWLRIDHSRKSRSTSKAAAGTASAAASARQEMASAAATIAAKPTSARDRGAWQGPARRRRRDRRRERRRTRARSRRARCPARREVPRRERSRPAPGRRQRESSTAASAAGSAMPGNVHSTPRATLAMASQRQRRALPKARAAALTTAR